MNNTQKKLYIGVVIDKTGGSEAIGKEEGGFFLWLSWAGLEPRTDKFTIIVHGNERKILTVALQNPCIDDIKFNSS